VPALYSPDWFAAFNAAVADLDVTTVDVGASLAAAAGSFRVAQVVDDGPDGATIRVVLTVADGRLSLALEPLDGPGEPVDVTLSLTYDDAAALSRHEVEPAALIGTGRVRVRGDLSVLVAGQALLAVAAPRLAALQADTTY
jgi:SCP-2 sterol transfer family protein